MADTATRSWLYGLTPHQQMDAHWERYIAALEAYWRADTAIREHARTKNDATRLANEHWHAMQQLHAEHGMTMPKSRMWPLTEGDDSNG